MPWVDGRWQDSPVPITQPAELSTSGDLVNERFAEAGQYADEAWSKAWEILEALRTEEYIVDWDAIELSDIPLMGLDGLGMEEPTVPTIEDVSIALPDFTKTDPDLDEPDIATDAVPVFDVSTPDFQVPTVPTVEWPLFTATEPAVSEVDLPTKPEYDVPVVPELDSISIPSPPDYTLPNFEGTAPIIDLTAPEPMLSITRRNIPVP